MEAPAQNDVRIESTWREALHDEFESTYFHELISFVKEEYVQGPCYPKGKDIFRAFDSCPLPQVKVVIIGQDPYHGPGQAHGLCFSVPEGVTFPPSLRNIFMELAADLGVRVPHSGDLSDWADQGVLLLNATLTVRAREAGSHQKKGWERFTDAVVHTVNEHCEHVVFILWGSYAQKKGFQVDRKKHLVLTAPHPSPLSAHRGFFGSRPFSQTNEYLRSHGRLPIQWGT
jgi:uracil-DNA glycosylase